MNDRLAINYIGMTKPKIINEKDYSIRITIKYIFPFTNGILRVNSIIYLELKTTISLLWTSQDISSIEALTIALQEIDIGINEYIANMPDLKNRNKPLIFSDLQETAVSLLNSRFELEN